MINNIFKLSKILITTIILNVMASNANSTCPITNINSFQRPTLHLTIKY